MFPAPVPASPQHTKDKTPITYFGCLLHVHYYNVHLSCHSVDECHLTDGMHVRTGWTDCPQKVLEKQKFDLSIPTQCWNLWPTPWLADPLWTLDALSTYILQLMYILYVCVGGGSQPFKKNNFLSGIICPLDFCFLCWSQSLKHFYPENMVTCTLWFKRCLILKKY